MRKQSIYHSTNVRKTRKVSSSSAKAKARKWYEDNKETIKEQRKKYLEHYKWLIKYTKRNNYYK